MRTVRLPIFKDGMETNEVLRIDVTFFMSSVSGLRSNQVDIVPKETKDAFAGRRVEEEIEVIDRIIHDLPPRQTATYKKQRVDDNVQALRDEEVGRPYHDWREIPGFKGYTMNPRKMIIDESTDKTVAQGSNGRARRVILMDKDAGRYKTMDVDFLFQKTFPELSE